ncbi:MAG: tRNA pseudouridine(38-40) synthase TruA [Candidatus Dormibacteraeota bacterium]|nr:tRNA pseudouridine(38-40) synthase TruA [Candidatus Dormibacteraeota bacterium]
MNIKLVLEYDGTYFSGWQMQAGRRTIEGEVRSALRSLTGAEHVVYGAGRTDAGAHALGQVANFRYDGQLSPERIRAGLNALLPEDVAVVKAEEAADDFHARYSARWRRYRYRWLDRPARPALERHQCWHVSRPLDVTKMQAASAHLVGVHDWTTFCSASEPPWSRVREILEASLGCRGRYVELDLLGQGFLRGLVRGVAGALTEVGLGRRPPRWVAQVLAARDREQAPKTAPARGLTLVEVLYQDP